MLADGGSDEPASAIGSTIRLDDAPCEVIGVMPKGFAFRDDRVRVWTALKINTEETRLNRGSHSLGAIARLREGLSAEQADAQLQSLRRYWSEAYPDQQYAKGHFAIFRPLHEDIVGNQRDALLLLGGAVLFVLLIVCVNLAALLVSNAEARRREFAVRYALGANRRRLIRQLLAEAMLLAVAGALLLIRSYQRLQQVDLGLEPDRVLTFSVSIPPGRQPDAAVARRTLAAIEDRLAATPGVEVVGAISELPLVSDGGQNDFVIEGRPKPAPGAPAWNARYRMATPRMFRALAIPLKRGRLLAESDARGRPLVAVINETAARLYWSGDDPIGSRIRYFPQETSPWIQIVGLVGDVRSLGASSPAPPKVYVPLA